LITSEAVAVRAQRIFTVKRQSSDIPMCRRNDLLGGSFKIEDIKCITRSLNAALL
jgi:hypothetical protein